MAYDGFYFFDKYGNYIRGTPEQAAAAGRSNQPMQVLDAPKLSFPDKTPPPASPTTPQAAQKAPEPETTEEYLERWFGSHGILTVRRDGQQSLGGPMQMTGLDGYGLPQQRMSNPVLGDPTNAPMAAKIDNKLGADSLLQPFRSMMGKIGGPGQNNNTGFQLLDDHQLRHNKTNSYLDDIIRNVAKWGVDNYGKKVI